MVKNGKYFVILCTNMIISHGVILPIKSRQEVNGPMRDAEKLINLLIISRSIMSGSTFYLEQYLDSLEDLPTELKNKFSSMKGKHLYKLSKAILYVFAEINKVLCPQNINFARG